ARPGDTLRFIGQNLDKVTSIQFSGTNAVVEQAAFKQQASDLILVTVPATAEKGYVTLKTPAGDIVTKTILNLNVKTAATIASVTKQARPGENITLSGNYLNWVTRITFGKNKVVTTFVSQSQNQLVVKVPDDAQTAPLLVSFSGTDTIDVQTADTLKVALPVAASFAPNPVKHADNVTITGTDLDLAKKVYFNGVTAAVTTFVSQSATQVVVKVPGAATKGKVKLEAASGVQTTSASDLDIAMPAITELAPNPVDIDANLTITGTNLDLVSGIAFTGVTATVTSFVSQTPTQLVVKVPAGAVLGKLTFSIANSTLTVKSPTDLQIVGSTVAPIVVYDNALNTGWQMWGGWGLTTKELENTEHPNSGTKAIKITYSDAYGGFQLHPNSTFPFPPAGYSKLKLSVYGGDNATATSRIAIYMKDATDPTDAQTKILTLVPGTYTTYEIPLTAFSNNPAKVNEFVIKNYGTANITIYVDDIWFQ
ncbi:MAG TPA: IPT/TIG domain-containing protein, partial [Flavisolibacter sp.]|nr:IPT/TIG domain-containing protein [Flavisolibacter sp.]